LNVFFNESTHGKPYGMKVDYAKYAVLFNGEIKSTTLYLTPDLKVISRKDMENLKL